MSYRESERVQQNPIRQATQKTNTAVKATIQDMQLKPGKNKKFKVNYKDPYSENIK